MAIKALPSGRWECSKYWPRGQGRFRREFPNKTQAKQMYDRLVGAIAGGTWPTLKAELDRSVEEAKEIQTIESYSKKYLEHCESFGNRATGRYELSFDVLNQRIGSLTLQEFKRHHLHTYVEQRSKDPSRRRTGQRVAANTINNEITALSGMFTYALERGDVEAHPLVRFPRLKLQEQEIRVPTPAEYATFIEKAAALDQVVAAYLAVLGELGCRKSEGLNMRRHWPNWENWTVTISGRTKGRKIRTVPLTDLAAEWIKKTLAVASLKDDHIFINHRTGRVWKEMRKIFEKARDQAGLAWMGLHALRHYRISRWFAEGLDPRTIQVYAGHSSISTTMKYCHFAPDPTRVMRQAQEA